MNNQPRVQKKNKNSKLSGYTLFVIEYNNRQVKDAKDAYTNKREIDRASRPWKELSMREQQKYKDRAKQMNIKIVHTLTRYNAIGEKLDDVKIRNLMIEEAKENRRCEIKQMLKNSYELAELDNHVFFLLATSMFYDDNEFGIYPAEVAIAKFSLVKGVFDTFSIKIDPGQLPMGSRLDVLDHSAATHKYNPDDEFDPGERNYIKILTQIVKFLHPFDDVPIFFTEGNDDIPTEKEILDKNQRILKLIFEEAGEYQAADELKVYSIDELLFYLRNIIVENDAEINPDIEDQPFQSFMAANINFKKVNAEFSFKAKGCDYHTREDALPHCCLAKVHGFGYTLAKWCAMGNKYELKAGFHYPEDLKHVENENLRIYK